jgi:hypothetical protein
MSRLFYLPHLGLGDLFLVNGMIRYFAKRNKLVVMPCKENNLITIKKMFHDLDNFHVLPVAGGLEYNTVQQDVKESQLLAKFYRQNGYDYVGLGFFGSKFQEFNAVIDNKTMTYDEFFYMEANVPFHEKWDSFGMKRDMEREKALFDRFGVKEGEYVFLHDDPERGRTIDRAKLPEGLPVVTPKQMFYKGDILDYGYVIENAKELHMTNSSFADLSDFFNLRSEQKKYIHLYALIDGHFFCPVRYKNNFKTIMNK